MSSDQFSSGRAAPRAARFCPNCDALVKDPSRSRCWLCGEPLDETRTTDRPSRHYEFALPGRVEAAGDNVALAVFGVLMVLICLGLAIETPGVLLILLVVLTPALIRTLVATVRQS